MLELAHLTQGLTQYRKTEQLQKKTLQIQKLSYYNLTIVVNKGCQNKHMIVLNTTVLNIGLVPRRKLRNSSVNTLDGK